MRIGEINDISIEHDPNQPSMEIFTIGCNFDCSFCPKIHLKNKSAGKEFSINELLGIIKTNLLVKGIVILGGEPTLQPDLISLCKEIKGLEKHVSIETNGTNPNVIKELLPNVDKFILKIYSPLKDEKLFKFTNVRVKPEFIIKSFKILNDSSNIEFDVLTTFIGGLTQPKDIHSIIAFLKKNNFSGNYVLKQYRLSQKNNNGDLLSFYKPEHYILVKTLEKYRNKKLKFNILLKDEVFDYKNLKDIFNQDINKITI